MFNADEIVQLQASLSELNEQTRQKLNEVEMALAEKRFRIDTLVCT